MPTFTPLFYALKVAYVLIIAALMWMALDSIRTVRTAQRTALAKASGKRREPLVVYQLFSGLAVVLYLLQLIAGILGIADSAIRGGLSRVSFVWTLLGIAVMALYLLRVVYPKGGHPPAETLLSAADADNKDYQTDLKTKGENQ
jgi:hypothetical protein